MKNIYNNSYFNNLYIFLLYESLIVKEKIKPSVLISIKSKNKIETFKKYKNQIINKLNLQCAVLKEKNDFLSLFIYDEKFLKETLREKEICDYLSNYGYNNSMGLMEKLNILKKNTYKNSYPHEIGVFLGYPLDDVRGFIENNGKDYKLSKYWKVYGNLQYSQHIFSKIDRIKQNKEEFLIKHLNIQDESEMMRRSRAAL